MAKGRIVKLGGNFRIVSPVQRMPGVKEVKDVRVRYRIR